jgi:tagatose 6-phosphate kinase
MTLARDERPGGGEPAEGRIRRVVCVAVNASVDKIAAVERLVPGEIHRPEMLSVVPGGKAINVARAAGRLGLEVVVVPVVAGHVGAWLMEALTAEGMTARPVSIEGETRTCLTILDRSAGRLTELYEPGPPIDAAGWARLEAAVTAALPDADESSVVAMSGSLLPGAPSDGYARLVALARNAGARAVVDADGTVLARALEARPWLVRVNAGEAARATGLEPGGETEALAAARALREGGADNALVTRGVDGALLVDEDGTAWRLGQPPGRGRYPVGSGDSSLAGFLAGVSAGGSAPEAGRWAVAAGAANALQAGQGAVDPADVRRILQEVSLAPISTHDPVEVPAGPPPGAGSPSDSGAGSGFGLPGDATR